MSTVFKKGDILQSSCQAVTTSPIVAEAFKKEHRAYLTPLTRELFQAEDREATGAGGLEPETGGDSQ